jgi:hypothetical protein
MPSNFDRKHRSSVIPYGGCFEHPASGGFLTMAWRRNPVNSSAARDRNPYAAMPVLRIGPGHDQREGPEGGHLLAVPQMWGDLEPITPAESRPLVAVPSFVKEFRRPRLEGVDG